MVAASSAPTHAATEGPSISPTSRTTSAPADGPYYNIVIGSNICVILVTRYFSGGTFTPMTTLENNNQPLQQQQNP